MGSMKDEVKEEERDRGQEGWETEGRFERRERRKRTKADGLHEKRVEGRGRR